MEIIKTNFFNKLQLTSNDYKFIAKSCSISIGVVAFWLGMCKLKCELQRQMGFKRYDYKQIGNEVGNGAIKSIIPGLFIGSIICILTYMRK